MNTEPEIKTGGVVGRCSNMDIINSMVFNIY
jgi:hypothetical protein